MQPIVFLSCSNKNKLIVLKKTCLLKKDWKSCRVKQFCCCKSETLAPNPLFPIDTIVFTTQDPLGMQLLYCRRTPCVVIVVLSLHQSVAVQQCLYIVIELSNANTKLGHRRGTSNLLVPGESVKIPGLEISVCLDLDPSSETAHQPIPIAQQSRLQRLNGLLLLLYAKFHCMFFYKQLLLQPFDEQSNQR